MFELGDLSDADRAGFADLDQLTREAVHLQVGMTRARAFPRADGEAREKLMRRVVGTQIAPRSFAWDGSGFVPSHELLDLAATCWRNLEVGSAISAGARKDTLRVQGYAFDLETGVRRSSEWDVEVHRSPTHIQAMARTAESEAVSRLLPGQLLDDAVIAAQARLTDVLEADDSRLESWFQQMAARFKVAHEVPEGTLRKEFAADTAKGLLQLMGALRAVEQGEHPAVFGLTPVE